MSQRSAKIDVILLAAGNSSRMGSENKLLMRHGRSTLIRHTAQQIINAKIGDLTVVTGFEADQVQRELQGLNLKFCHNLDHDTGQMSSVKAGSQVINPMSKGMMVALSDMPYLKPLDYRNIVRHFVANEGQKITVPFYGEERGNPIVIPAALISEIACGSLNAGCRKLVQNHPDKVIQVKFENSAYVSDIDTPADYANCMKYGATPSAICC
ncbi:MAG: nucleotidyltransferase family protein [Sneathiella sp.]